MPKQETDKAVETWEIQVPGTIRVLVLDRRTGLYRTQKVNGTKGPKILRLTTDEREYNEELVPAENDKLNPFRNGALARKVEGGKLEGITEETLDEFIELEDEDVFREAVADVNELTARRLIDKARKDGRVWQVEALQDLIDEKWRVGGTQPTVAEMFASGELETVTS